MELNIDRINELARKQKTTGLTEAERTEQALLRKNYIESFRNNLRCQLENMSIENEDGSIVHVKDLKKKE